nr:LON peptidase substrate-binding domain-containing protein [Janibacter hoylei]
MFPLGTVLLPGQPLPLQVFEPRYLTMLRDVADGDGRFGVVLIDRGFEVGGEISASLSGASRASSRSGRWAEVGSVSSLAGRSASRSPGGCPTIPIREPRSRACRT